METGENDFLARTVLKSEKSYKIIVPLLMKQSLLNFWEPEYYQRTLTWHFWTSSLVPIPSQVHRWQGW